MTLLLAVWIVVAIVWLLAVLQLGVEREWHHIYVGLALTLIALLLPWPIVRLVLGWLGLVIGADDAWQHLSQWLRHDLRYRSPLHLLYRRVYARLPKWGQL